MGNNTVRKKIHNFIEILLIVCLFTLNVFTLAKAATLYSNKQTTGYAMGNRGWGTHTFVRGDVATHASGYCGDPAGYWARGTRLDMTVGVNIPGFNGLNPNYDYYTTFYKWDVGDLNCVKNMYWLDIYFYRYIRTGEVCTCPGVTTPAGSCVSGAKTNSCTNATNYGAQTKSYYGPP